MSDIKKNNKKKIKAQDTVESSAQAQKEETPSKISDGAEGENKDSPASLDVAAVAVDRAENDPSRRRWVTFLDDYDSVSSHNFIFDQKYIW